MRVPRSPAPVGDCRPESACPWHAAISAAGPPSPANPAILWRVPLVTPSGGFGGAVDCVGRPSPTFGAGSKSWLFACTTGNPDLCGFAMILRPQNWRGGGRTRVPACVCAGLGDPSGSLALGPSGMPGIAAGRPFQYPAAKHRNRLVHTRDGLRTLPARARKPGTAAGLRLPPWV